MGIKDMCADPSYLHIVSNLTVHLGVNLGLKSPIRVRGIQEKVSFHKGSPGTAEVIAHEISSIHPISSWFISTYILTWCQGSWDIGIPPSGKTR